MSGIVEFLEARIAEDEAVARAATRSGDGHWTAGEHSDEDGEVYDQRAVFGDDLHIYDEGGHDENHADHIARHDPARVLAECAAKRTIIHQHADATGWDCTTDESRCPTLQAIAAVYADHPDYQQEWAT